MAKLDTSKGWCCDGRTWVEHAHADGQCCQPEGTQLDELPEGARKAAEKRLDEEGGEGSAEPATSGSESG